MPASITRPVAAGHRHVFRIHGLGALRLLSAAALLLFSFGLAAAQEPVRPSLDKNSLYLRSAGFSIQIANDAAGKKALHALPAHRFVINGAGEAARYLYAEPDHCVCIFVGTQQAYDRYLKFINQPQKAADDVAPNYKTEAGVLLSNQPARQSTFADPTTLSDYLNALRPQY
jgi:hypothetical protein